MPWGRGEIGGGCHTLPVLLILWDGAQSRSSSPRAALLRGVLRSKNTPTAGEDDTARTKGIPGYLGCAPRGSPTGWMEGRPGTHRNSVNMCLEALEQIESSSQICKHFLPTWKQCVCVCVCSALAIIRCPDQESGVTPPKERIGELPWVLPDQEPFWTQRES